MGFEKTFLGKIKKIMRFFCLLVIIICLDSQEALSQRFKASAILGINASQIDGDSLYGFDKLGLTVGGRLSYVNNAKFDIAMEMLYSQRGASAALLKKDDPKKIKLNFLEIPVIVSLRDWYIEKGNFYKVRAEAGLSYGYLFGVTTPGFDATSLGKSDVSWLIGAGINFTKTLGFSVRYTSSFLDIYRDKPDIITFKSYFLTFRSEINF